MGTVILTTETLHHAYFVRELSRVATIEWVALETRACVPPFETAHPFETRRDAHEREAWFDGRAAAVGEFAEAWQIDSVNDDRVVQRLQLTNPSLVLVFGTGRLRERAIATAGANALNLHGGDPLAYRGLDSHLWSIYHRDYDALKTTLHRISPALDRGDIVAQAGVPVRRDMGLHELRRANTEVCVQLATHVIQSIQHGRPIGGMPQDRIGRYYSHMPSVLKSICVDRFAAHTRSLA